MNHPVGTSMQLKPVLRALRERRNVSQADLGRTIGVNQKRVARIEANPGVTSFAQIARIVSALGARLVVEVPEDSAPSPTRVPASKRPTARGRKVSPEPTW